MQYKDLNVDEILVSKFALPSFLCRERNLRSQRCVSLYKKKTVNRDIDGRNPAGCFEEQEFDHKKNSNLYELFWHIGPIKFSLQGSKSKISETDNLVD